MCSGMYEILSKCMCVNGYWWIQVCSTGTWVKTREDGNGEVHTCSWWPGTQEIDATYASEVEETNWLLHNFYKVHEHKLNLLSYKQQHVLKIQLNSNASYFFPEDIWRGPEFKHDGSPQDTLHVLHLLVWQQACQLHSREVGLRVAVLE